MDLSFLSEADAVMLEMEKARRALETAKADFENAKRGYDELLSRADEIGIPKAKLKKLVEDRISLLFESGLLDFVEKRDEPGAKRVRKPKRPSKATGEESATEAPSAPESADAVPEERL